jgi:hypothetical protein
MLWTLAIAASVVWNTHLLREAMFEAATTDARSDLDMDVLYRHWAALHGSVYVPVTALTFGPAADPDESRLYDAAGA